MKQCVIYHFCPLSVSGCSKYRNTSGVKYRHKHAVTKTFSSKGVKTKRKKVPYVSLVIQLVVGEFELVETDHLPHPGVSWGQRVRVDVGPRRHRGVGVSCNHPLGAVVHIPARQDKETRLGTKNLVAARIQWLTRNNNKFFDFWLFFFFTYFINIHFFT